MSDIIDRDRFPLEPGGDRDRRRPRRQVDAAAGPGLAGACGSSAAAIRDGASPSGAGPSWASGWSRRWRSAPPIVSIPIVLAAARALAERREEVAEQTAARAAAPPVTVVPVAALSTMEPARGRHPSGPTSRRRRTGRGPGSDGVLAIAGARTGSVLGVVHLAGRHARPDRPADPGEPGPGSARPAILRCAGGHRPRMPGDRRAPGLSPRGPRRPLVGGRDPLPGRDRPPRAAAPRSERRAGRPAGHPRSRAGARPPSRPGLEPRGAPRIDRCSGSTRWPGGSARPTRRPATP